ncbi:biliverdin-producing heme oxygenase [Pseudomonas stutzeri]|uniref:Heme oxygenase n=1 Tax=Stutzerimonas stutzeri TaxID=316 RepID=A0A2N8RWS5_STUST|nr:biliverdin-producing heme oxygenase [Stutzerimonas stutzeri]MCQ4297950.1 biliverdin-producing heme oxygenase [Stutzerimonas stutzeri]PNF78823.1 heme oxygenase [Stutzerimonas stutzeri]
MAELRARLRQATATLHEQVDSAFSGFALDQPDDYRRFLRAHARVLNATELSLERAGIAELLDDWPTRARRHALLADLAELDCPSPPPLQAPQISGIASCWGVAYVLEGSRLGGRVLARRIRQADPSAPVRYLEHGDVSKLWPNFLTRLEQAAPGCAWEPMLAAAQATFELFADAAVVERGCEYG